MNKFLIGCLAILLAATLLVGALLYIEPILTSLEIQLNKSIAQRAVAEAELVAARGEASIDYAVAAILVLIVPCLFALVLLSKNNGRSSEGVRILMLPPATHRIWTGTYPPQLGQFDVIEGDTVEGDTAVWIKG